MRYRKKGPITHRAHLHAALVTLLGLAASGAQADYRDFLVQAPELKAPQRGSLAGAYGDLSVGPGDLARGSFTLPSPFQAPTERGPLLADVFPAYTPDAGQSEWGMGFRTGLTIRRHAAVGEIDYATDDLATPWGIARRGADGSFYPLGMQKHVVVTMQGASLVARLDDGTKATFLASDAVSGSRGVYEWWLSTVQSPLGDRTELTYERNASGRPFVSKVRYGGRAPEQLQYELSFSYEQTPLPLHDLRSGEALTLDRRVRSVKAGVYVPATGTYATRYRYDLTYSYSEAGAAFFLASVKRTFASGASEPAFEYEYEFAEDELANAHLEHVPALDSYLEQVGSEGIQPTSVSFMDIDRDGRVDMEHHYDNTLIRRTDAGWEFEALPPRSTSHHPQCRPAPSWNNEPRNLVRMRPSAVEPNVVVTVPAGAFGGTQLVVCDRPGNALHTQTLDDEWTLGPNVRLVDLDRDLKPDFLRVYEGGYQVLRNLSDDAGFAFEAEEPVALELGYGPLASWVQDMNGDTLPDLVARHASGLDVFYGVGGRRFVETPTTFNLYTGDGQMLGDLSQYQLVFTDANKDGLTDVILAQGQYLFLYTNRGSHFSQFDVPGLGEIAWDVGLPVAVDLEGRGEEQAVVVDGQEAWAVTLSRPGAGLLISARDGRGGCARFGYERSRPTPGIQWRPPMLVEMKVSGVALDELTYAYDYLTPSFHGSGQYLLGFGLVQMETPAGVGEARFHHDDDVSGLLLETRSTDARIPFVYKLEEHGYTADSFRGVAWWKKQSSRTAFRDSAGHDVLGTLVEHAEYDAQLCARRETRTTSHGKLTITRDFAQPTALLGALVCLPSRETATTTHPGRPQLDATYVASVDRDAQGQTTLVRSEVAGDVIEAQRSSYDEKHRLVELRSAAGGRQVFMWDEQTGALRGTVQPDGVVAVATSRDPLSDALLELVTTRDQATVHDSYRYDGLERLHRRWNDLGAASASAPLETVTYAYAADGKSASTLIKKLVDASASAYSETLELASSSGDIISQATRQPGGWAFGGVELTSRSEGKKTAYTRAPLASVDGHAISMATLLDPAAMLLRSETWSSPFGHVAESDQTVADGVSQHVRSTLELGAQGVLVRTTENGSYVSELVQDGDGRILSSTDAGGARTAREYDALGRLVKVVLPGGQSQSVRYDAHGRVTRVDHPGVMSVLTSYAPATGLLAQKTFLDAQGTAHRRIEYTHDALGRVSEERQVRLSDGAQRSYSFGYDGATPFGAQLAGQRGFRSSVVAPGFRKEQRYRADGLLTRTNVELAGHRLVQTDQSYTEGGELRGSSRKVFDAQGNLLVQVSQELRYDAYGRPSEVLVNGTRLARLHHDADGRVEHVELPDGQVLVFDHDAITREQVGFTHDAEGFLATFRTERNERGLIGAERIEWSTGSGETGVHDREYGYDARRFLSTSGQARYEYGADGLPTRTRDLLGERAFTLEGDIMVADVNYAFDAAGRVIARGALSFEYGPSGQIERATRGSDVFSFVYDESDQRVAKLKNGQPDALYVDGALLSSDDVLLEPVRIAGHVVGVLENGEYRAVATDARGTALGSSSFADSSPYGVRSSHDELAAVIDYAEKGYDPDLGVVRMGVRDYDPLLGRFLTPDPLFSVDTEACAKSPVECNLYGYAGNDPVAFVDPEGKNREVTEAMAKKRMDQRYKNAQSPMDYVSAFLGSALDAKTLEQAERSRSNADAVRQMMVDWGFSEESSPGGSYLFGSDAASFTSLVNAGSSLFVIAGHGSPGVFGIKGPATSGGNNHWVILSTDEILDLAKDGGFKNGQPIMLQSCNGGVAPANGKSVAQNLADKTGSYVMAPSDFLYTDGRIGHYTNGTWIPGGWVVVAPSRTK